MMETDPPALGKDSGCSLTIWGATASKLMLEEAVLEVFTEIRRYQG